MRIFVLKWQTQWDKLPPENHKRTYWSEKQARRYIKKLQEYQRIYAMKNIKACLMNIELYELSVPNPRQLPV